VRRARATRPVDRPGSRRKPAARPAATGIRTHRRPARRVRGNTDRPLPNHYPRAAAAAATLAGYISTQQYLWGLRRILDAITPDMTTVLEAQGRGPRLTRKAGEQTHWSS
jgi:hypothetical protein